MATTSYIDSVLSGTSSTSSTSTTSSSNGAISETDFYELLCTELQYQDPLDPMSNTEYTALLAQYETMSGINDMKESMDTMAQLTASSNNLSAMSMIGKNVYATGNIVNYDGTSQELNFDLGEDASTITVKVYNSSGSLVRTDELSNLSEGESSYTWDGKDDDGNTLDQGKYYFSVSAQDYDGNAVTATTYAYGEVTGVKFEDGVTYLTVGSKDVLLSSITKISE